MFQELVILCILAGAIHGEEKPARKKLVTNVKRAVDTYSYPLPNVRFEDKSNVKTKVIVETIKSISPSEYLPPSGESLCCLL